MELIDIPTKKVLNSLIIAVSVAVKVGLQLKSTLACEYCETHCEREASGNKEYQLAIFLGNPKSPFR